MLTAVRMMSIGAASFGALVIHSMTPCGNSRSARSAVVSRSSSCAVGSRFVPEQVDDFLVADLAGQFIDVVAAVNELADVSAHIADAGFGRDDSFKPS
ncbi:MAG: hypothetical protein WDN28_23110 [Chthoniobacter sp.]